MSEEGVHQKDTEESQESCTKSRPPQKRRAIIRVESAETRAYVSALPADESLGSKKREAEDEENREELCFVPSAVSEPRWALHLW